MLVVPQGRTLSHYSKLSGLGSMSEPCVSFIYSPLSQSSWTKTIMSSCIRHSSCTHVASCHVMFNCLASVNNQFAPCNNRHYAQCQPSRPRNLGPFFAGRDAVASMQRLLKRTGFWSASIVRLDLLQAPMHAAGGKTAANQVDRANAVPKLRGSRVASHACWAFAIT